MQRGANPRVGGDPASPCSPLQPAAGKIVHPEAARRLKAAIKVDQPRMEISIQTAGGIQALMDGLGEFFSHLSASKVSAKAITHALASQPLQLDRLSDFVQRVPAQVAVVQLTPAPTPTRLPATPEPVAVAATAPPLQQLQGPEALFIPVALSARDTFAMIRVVSCTVLDGVTLVEVEWAPSWVDCVAVLFMALIDVPLNTVAHIIDRVVISVGGTDLFRVERVTMAVRRGERFFGGRIRRSL